MSWISVDAKIVNIILDHPYANDVLACIAKDGNIVAFEWDPDQDIWFCGDAHFDKETINFDKRPEPADPRYMITILSEAQIVLRRKNNPGHDNPVECWWF